MTPSAHPRPPRSAGEGGAAHPGEIARHIQSVSVVAVCEIQGSPPRGAPIQPIEGLEDRYFTPRAPPTIPEVHQLAGMSGIHRRIPQRPLRSDGNSLENQRKTKLFPGAGHRFLGWIDQCQCLTWVIGTRWKYTQGALPMADGSVGCRDGHIPSVFGLRNSFVRNRL